MNSNLVPFLKLIEELELSEKLCKQFLLSALDFIS